MKLISAITSFSHITSLQRHSSCLKPEPDINAWSAVVLTGVLSPYLDNTSYIYICHTLWVSILAKLRMVISTGTEFKVINDIPILWSAAISFLILIIPWYWILIRIDLKIDSLGNIIIFTGRGVHCSLEKKTYSINRYMFCSYLLLVTVTSWPR